jgi:5-methylcytosine-specific restriction enzyme subunit McrC
VAFTVDMDKLFEKFIEEVVAEEARGAGWRLVPQAPRMLTQTTRMKPDLVLQRNGHDYAVGDAKYKRLELDEMPHADLYQLLAYCASLGLPRGVLIYASFEPLHREVVRRLGTELHVLGLDMTGTPDEVLSQARRRRPHQPSAARRKNPRRMT